MCGREALALDANPAAPFCSSRCRLLDLGNWLGDAYRIPAEPDEDAPLPPLDDSSDDDGGLH